MSKKRGKVVNHPAVREWHAGKPDIMRSGWGQWSRPIDADIRSNLPGLRARSREEAQNNDYARSFLREVRNNVAGPHGFVLQSRVKLANGKPDTRTQEIIERGFALWGESPEVTGRMDWCDMQHQFVETVARDGEAFYRVVPWDNEFGVALQTIDPETIDIHYNAELPNGNAVVMGVEVDDWRRPVAYHLLEEKPVVHSQAYRRERKRVRVPADEILHRFLPEWVWQTRGVPWMATALRRLNDLNGYDEAAVVAARAGAANMGFYKQTDEAQPQVDKDGRVIGGPGSGQHANGELYDSFEAGRIGVLPYGYEFEGFDPRYPHANHSDFTKTVLRGIFAGTGVNYNAGAQDWEGTSWASLREAKLREQDHWLALQSWAIRAFVKPVFGIWLKAALASRALRRPGGMPLDVTRDDLADARFQGRRWKWVDPAKEAAAVEKEIAMNTRSISSVIRERGEDPEDVWAEIVAENKRLEELGITKQQAVEAVTKVTPDDEESTDDGKS